MTTFKKQLKDKDGNTIYPDVGLNLDDVVYSEDPNNTDLDNIIDPSSYSTEEKWTGGYWTDGKPIYKKTVYFGALPDSTSKDVSHGISNLDYVVAIDGTVKTGDGYFLPVNMPMTSSLAAQIRCIANSSYIRINTGSDRTDNIAYVTLYYTKSS